MKKIIFYIFHFAFLIPFLNLSAQENQGSKVRVIDSQVNKSGNDLMISMDLDLSNLDLKSQHMIVITPKLKSNSDNSEVTFKPVVLSGAKREKAINRAIHFGDYQYENTPRDIRRWNNNSQTVSIKDTVSYQTWQRDARLVFEEEIMGCNCAKNDQNEVLARILPPPMTPQFLVAVLVPEAEPVKQRSETYDAYLNFVVNRYELLRNFKNNAEVLDEVNEIVTEIRTDPNLEVNELKVIGYASPEGNINSNLVLSRNRALSFVNYLQELYGIDPSRISIDWKGEDWEGLKRIVAGLDIPEKYDVMAIIDADTDRNITKRKLHQLNGGTTYRMLLNTYYPVLRRNEYTVSYVAKPFDIEEARRVILTKPHHLSLNEIYLVANSYPKNSDEYLEAFKICSQVYPDDPTAKVVVAMPHMESGDYDMVITHLEGVDLPEALNNLGVAYAYKKDFEKAEDCFRRAQMAQSEHAVQNAELLSQWIEDQY